VTVPSPEQPSVWKAAGAAVLEPLNASAVSIEDHRVKVYPPSFAVGEENHVGRSPSISEKTSDE